MNSYELLADALESLKLLPQAPPLWQRVSLLSNGLDDAGRQELIGTLSNMAYADPAIEWLRCSALAYISRDPTWFERQAGLAPQLKSADAVMTMLNLAWLHALARSAQRQDFVALLRDMDAPRLQQMVAPRPASARPPRAAGQAPRIAVYTPQVVNNRHGGTAFTLNIMSMLAQQGIEMRAFCAQESSIPADSSYYGGAEAYASYPLEADTIKLHVPGSFQLMVAPTEFSLRSRLQQMQAAIDAYDPDLVIFVGFMSPLAHSLYQRYPMVGMSVHAVPPAVPVDVWLAADADGNTACWPSLPPPALFHFPYRFWPAAAMPPLDRASANLPQDALVLLTTGNRLRHEIAAPWSTRMLAFLDAHPQVHWVLVGIEEGKYPTALPIHPRIHAMPAYVQLVPWLRACDIFVNPPRVGGGASVAMAMEQGLPVLSYADSDGGDKLAEWAMLGENAYFSRLREWAGNTEARLAAGQAQQRRFRERLDTSGPQARAGLQQAVQLALERFHQRTQNSHE